MTVRVDTKVVGGAPGAIEVDYEAIGDDKEGIKN